MYNKVKKRTKNNTKDFNEIKNKFVIKRLKSKYTEENDMYKNFEFSRNLFVILSHSLCINSMILKFNIKY